MSITHANIGIIVLAALGYFVNVFDLIIFSLVRTKSLLALGVSQENSLDYGLKLLNCQLLGLIVGSVFWGALGDKVGRLFAMFASLMVCSLASIFNTFVISLKLYAMLRFIAGFGLAGELGIGMVIVLETSKVPLRTIGPMAVSTLGLLGGLAAVIITDYFEWRTCYLIGGVIGMLNVLFRAKLRESPIFLKLGSLKLVSGNIWQIVSTSRHLILFIKCIAIGLPVYFGFGLLISGAPEFSLLVGCATSVSVSQAMLSWFPGIALGSMISCFFSERIESRKVAFGSFLLLCVLSYWFFLFYLSTNFYVFLLKCTICGFSCGYWSLVTVNAAEQFGTNYRATMASMVPNFVRAGFIPMIWLFEFAKSALGATYAASITGLCALCAAIFALFYLPETFAKDLDYTDSSD
jgi:MFS transporter, putative metabolite:H+ symporter